MKLACITDVLHSGWRAEVHYRSPVMKNRKKNTKKNINKKFWQKSFASFARNPKSRHT
jgi:hypothetical protein